ISLACLAHPLPQRLQPYSLFPVRLPSAAAAAMNEVVIAAANRSDVGKFNSAISEITASELGAHVSRYLKATFASARQITLCLLGSLQRICPSPSFQYLVKSRASLM
ncbi:MAG TPA: hypothetical protein VI140_03035, partial [Oxalicibacterium sp.]